MTEAQVRKLFLSFPKTEEKSHFGQPDFRVANKIFAGLDRSGKRGTLKLSAKTQAKLLAAQPDVFSPAAGAWGRQGWTHFDRARIKTAELRPLAREAFGLIAPKALLAELDDLT